jgi:hypothetical protein
VTSTWPFLVLRPNDRAALCATKDCHIFVDPAMDGPRHIWREFRFLA